MTFQGISPNRASTWAIFWPPVAGLVINGLVFALGWNGTGESASNPLLPSGPIIGLIWMGLLLGMGYALAQLRAAGDRSSSRLTVFLILSCLAYPFYAQATGSAAAGYTGSMVTFVIGIAAVLASRRISPIASWLLLLVPIWVFYATLALLLG